MGLWKKGTERCYFAGFEGRGRSHEPRNVGDL